MSECVFCEIVNGRSEAEVLAEYEESIVIRPLNPHAPGHALVIPRFHTADALVAVSETRLLFGDVVSYASSLNAPVNILTSVGKDATQTVFHTHVHVIPRGPEDGLDSDWPWMRY